MNVLARLVRVEMAIGRLNRWLAASAVAANTEQGGTINAMDGKALQGEIDRPVAPPKRRD